MKWIKYYIIVMVGLMTGESIINIFGGTYVVYGNNVKRIG